MSHGEEGDQRQFRRPRPTDYYEAKAAAEAPQKTKWDRCEVCGMDITGKVFRGSEDGKFLCFRCNNE